MADKKLRILIVDDGEALAQTLGFMVELLGHEYRIAHNGADALSIAQVFLPDVALIDLGLPDMSGYEVGKKFREIPVLAHCKLIVQSGRSGSEYRTRSEEAGFDRYLVKPVQLEMLEQVLLTLTRQGSR